MIRAGWSSSDRRTLVGGFAAIGVLVALGRGLPAAERWEAGQRQAADSAAEQLFVARSAAHELSSFRDSLRVRHDRLVHLDSLMLTAADPSAAAAQLAAVLEDAAGDAGVRISGLQIRPDSAVVASLAHVLVRLTGTTDVAGLAAFLREVEGGDMPLAVRELTVGQPEPTAPSSKPESLRIDVLVEGLAVIAPRAGDRRT